MVSDGQWRGAQLLQGFPESLEKFSDPVHADLFKTDGQKRRRFQIGMRKTGMSKVGYEVFVEVGKS